MKYLFRILCLCAALAAFQHAGTVTTLEEIIEEECTISKDICLLQVEFWYDNRINDVWTIYNRHTAQCESNYGDCQARRPIWFSCKISRFCCYRKARKLRRTLLSLSHDDYMDAKDECNKEYEECKKDPKWQTEPPPGYVISFEDLINSIVREK